MITIKNLRAINEVLKRLNNLRRWTEFVTEGKYDEIAKQSLNCAITFILATEYEASGETIIWERFPKIAIYRAFQKAYVNYDTPEHILEEICALGKIPFKKSFGEVIAKTITELTDEDFTKWISDGCGTTEEKIYKAATKIATFLELNELQHHMNGEFKRKYEEIVISMRKYQDITVFESVSDIYGNYFKVFKSISRLRNQNRWAAYSYLVDCSVLGHLFDTAVLAYFMALEKGENEEIATKCFFMGIFHDVPEAFTRDIPSPIKDKIHGFRKLTEEYELSMMEQKVYPFLPKEVAEALKSVMFEDESNQSFKKLMKGADYMSAVSEIWRQLKAGTRDDSFVEALNGHVQKLNDSKIAELTTSTKMLLDEIADFANRIEM